MKKYFFIATTALLLASCQSDDFIGNTPGSKPDTSNAAITFDGETGKISRATEGAEAAKLLNNNFVVYGYKTKDNTASVVYNYYNVNWVTETSSSESSTTTSSWKYVGQSKNNLNTGQDAQTIKYWDFSASQYDFIAFSYGKATTDQVKATFTMKENSKALDYYTLEGTVNDLGLCYVADRATAKNSGTKDNNYTQYAFNDKISFNFRTVTTKVRLGIYETIPGYSVKNVKFYSKDDDTNADETVKLITTNNVSVPTGTDKASVKITFDESTNKATFTWTKTGDSDTKSYVELGNLKNKTQQARTRGDISSNEFIIGKDTKDNASETDYCSVIPAELGDLTLKVDYTLVSDDGSGEEILVKGANVKITKTDLTSWKENTAYTYIFKISDKTNGYTGETTNPAGLYPIEFDAVVTVPTDVSPSEDIDIKKDNTTENKGE